MKKLLIIQKDEPYFLLETLLMLNRFKSSLKDFQLTILVDPESLKQLQDGSVTIDPGVTTNTEIILNQSFDISANLSLNEISWTLHGKVNSSQKIGPYQLNQQLMVPDAWSSFLLTLKSGAPFLTFHLQDIYKNILGIKKMAQATSSKKSYHDLVFSLSNTSFFPADEQEKLIHLLNAHFPHFKIKDISEVDPVSDLSHVIYIGPASLEALKICEAGATGIYLAAQFQGFNLLPYNEGNFYLSAKNNELTADSVLTFIRNAISHEKLPTNFPHAAYKISEEHLFGSFLESLSTSDDSYPLYQAHVVLWNFVLNLFDMNLEIIRCSPGQIQLLRSQKEILLKIIRLYDYAMSSVDNILQQAKSHAEKAQIQSYLQNLQEIESITDKISQTHSFLRPVLDFYRIRRGQNDGQTLLAQSQHSFLLYSEEQQALQALLELITVTLQKNEVNI